ncbi:hypothetical protein GFK91_22130 [Roseibium aggregatum]|nr:hypothetical protein GFK88_14520 [Roseibium aggregatum]UES58075.1 hypothetical protein GFK91_22130 [Roseibium aggregatum]
MRDLLLFFCACEMVMDRLPPRLNGAIFEVGGTRRRTTICRVFMDENVQKSCWSVTLWTVAAVGLALTMVLLFNDVESAQQAVAAAK